jgi:hypothetical protein
MIRKNYIYRCYFTLLLCVIQTAGIALYGQNHPRAAAKRMQQESIDSLQNAEAKKQSILNSTDTLAISDSIATENKRKLKEITSNVTPKVILTPADSLQTAIAKKVWHPSPVKATWLALVLPGGGQIYNRKYWKLPIIYGGFAGCAYALSWNNKMYKDYMQAYKDAIKGNWNATSITDLIPPGYSISKDQLTSILQKRKNTYRRYRDMSVFAFIGVYLLSVIDAYVDAELSNFDISPDLSMRIEPAVINNQSGVNTVSSRSIGVQCSFRF